MHQHMPIHADKYICKDLGLHASYMSCKLKIYSRNGHCMAENASCPSHPCGQQKKGNAVTLVTVNVSGVGVLYPTYALPIAAWSKCTTETCYWADLS